MDGAFGNTKQDAQRYPVIYRVVVWVRICSLVAAPLFSGGMSYLTFFPPYAAGSHAITIDPVLIGMDALVTASMAYFVWWAFSARIVLREDAFEQYKPFVARVLKVSNIAGRRYTDQGGYPEIVPKSGMPFWIDRIAYGLDGRFDEWFGRLPDFREIQRKEELERIREDPTLGANPAERMTAASRRHSAYVALSAVLAILAVATIFMAFRHERLSGGVVSLAAMLPWCAVMLMLYYKDQVLGPDGGKAAVIMLVPLLVPISVLGVLAADISGLLDVFRTIVSGAVVGLPLLFAMVFSITRKKAVLQEKLISLLIYAPFACVYGGSTLALSNDLLDNAPVPVYTTQVLGKYAVRGKSSTQHYLELAPWGPLQKRTDLLVESVRYFGAHKGDVVCMSLHPGKFGLRWIHSAPCRGAESATAMPATL